MVFVIGWLLELPKAWTVLRYRVLCVCVCIIHFCQRDIYRDAFVHVWPFLVWELYLHSSWNKVVVIRVIWEIIYKCIKCKHTATKLPQWPLSAKWQQQHSLSGSINCLFHLCALCFSPFDVWFFFCLSFFICSGYLFAKCITILLKPAKENGSTGNY